MNGFDDLERQLRAKVSARAVARARRPLLRTLALAAGVLATGGAVTAAATGVIGGPDTDQQASKLLNSVIKATRHVPVCRLHAPDRRPARLSELPASALALRAFPALRRAPTARERAFARRYGRMAGMSQVLSGGARLLRATDGSKAMLMITAGRGRSIGADPGCIPIERAELARRAPGVDPAVLAAARQSLDREEQAYRDNLGREGLLLAQLGADGRLASAGGTFTDVAVRLGTGSFGTLRVRGRSRLGLDGLVPKPADHVIIRSRTHPGKPSIRIAVPQQVFHAVLPAHYGTRISVGWHAPDGRLLHVMHLNW